MQVGSTQRPVFESCLTFIASYGTGTGNTFLDQAEAEGWLCDVCQNETTLESSLVRQMKSKPVQMLNIESQVSDCVLCPGKRKNEKKRASATPSPKDENDVGFLRAKKPTEGQNWVHILCSLYAPEVSYTDASRLRLVEGISSISQARWEMVCCLLWYIYACLSDLRYRFVLYAISQVSSLNVLRVPLRTTPHAPGKLVISSHSRFKWSAV